MLSAYGGGEGGDGLSSQRKWVQPETRRAPVGIARLRGRGVAVTGSYCRAPWLLLWSVSIVTRLRSCGPVVCLTIAHLKASR